MWTTGDRPTKHTYNCAGAFVVTDNVASSVTLPDHMETVAPIIHRAGERDPCDRGCAPQPHAEIAPPPMPQKTAMTVTLSDSFGNGGVGMGITGGSSYSRAYIVSGGSAQGYASASAIAFAVASSYAFAGGAHGCGCGR